MGAHSDEFPWPSYYGNFRKLEAMLRNHSKVDDLERLTEGLYTLTLISQEELKLFIGECYSFGVAEYDEVTQNYGAVDIVLISSAWCGYGLDVKKYCRDLKVGVFKIGDLMSALNMENFHQHLNESEAEHFADAGWL